MTLRCNEARLLQLAPERDVALAETPAEVRASHTTACESGNALANAGGGGNRRTRALRVAHFTVLNR